MKLRESTRRRIAAVAAGLLLLLLISCNIGRLRRSIGGDSTTAVATVPPLGTSPLPTGAPPASTPAVAVPRQPSPVAGSIRPATAATPGLPSNAPPDAALNPASASAQPAGGSASSPAGTASSAVSVAVPSAPQPVNAQPAGGPRPNAFSTILGTARRATGTTLPGAKVRLRDARFGRIIETQLSDQSGAFAFRTIDPGVYIVEVVGDDQRVLAASQLLNVSAGDTISTFVRLPGNDSTRRNAAIVAAAAAAAGVLTTTATEPVSPTQ